MKFTKKIISCIIFTIIAFSYILAAPGVIGAVPDTTIVAATDHSLTEDEWSIIYDFAGDYLEKDLTPGIYSGNATEGLTDKQPFIDANFFIAYTNMGQVQTLYIANKNMTTDSRNITKFGCAPYQLLIQHFRTIGNIEVFVVNTFVGLMAYQENPETADGVPNGDDNIYAGWMAYGELFKHYANRGLEVSGVPENNRFDPNTHAECEIIDMTKEVNGNKLEYRYGVSYSNLFVFWQSIEVENSKLNNTAEINEAVMKDVVAFCMVDTLNFTYIIRGEKAESGQITNVTTTTEYQIGEINNLWIRDDGPGVAAEFGGNHYNYNILGEQGNMTLYNDSAAIKSRLQGNISTPGFGLAVANYADLITLGANKPGQYLRNRYNETMNNAATTDRNFTRAEFMLAARNRAVKAFAIDYEGKDNYLLGDETTPREAQSVIVRNTRLRSPIASQVYGIGKEFVMKVYQAAASDFGVQDKLRVLWNANSIFYLTCFPVWNGEQIVNDPTFTAFAGAGISLGGRQIPSYNIELLMIISVISVVAIILIKKRNFSH